MSFPKWVIEEILARSCRPGYYSYLPTRVEIVDVDEWIEHAQQMGIQSIICLLSEEQLAYYRHIPNGLIQYYRANGFAVQSIPITDPASDPKGEDELLASLDRIYQTFLELPKPVLIHCSAGRDRTGKAVQYIQSRYRPDIDTP